MDPYRIWLSEVILQQTRVDQGLDYYRRFVEKYPNVRSLAAATEDEILKLWQGLGYYSRARNMHQAARTIVEEYNSVFPSDYQSLIRLKGIGPYTAAAVASIAFGEPVPVIDGNVMRVVSRWFAIEEPVNTAAGKNAIAAALDQIIDKKQPGKFNQALMEFGALFCKPRNPDCENCIFAAQCLAFQNKMVDRLPAKQKKAPQRTRYFYYLFIRRKAQQATVVYFRKRPPGDIWQGLYDFPLIESSTETDPDALIRTKDWQIFFGPKKLSINKVSPVYIHQLTHQRIVARFVEIDLHDDTPFDAPLQAVPFGRIRSLPVPRLIDKFINDMLVKP